MTEEARYIRELVRGLLFLLLERVKSWGRGEQSRKWGRATGASWCEAGYFCWEVFGGS